jgi:hypothetical protein
MTPSSAQIALAAPILQRHGYVKEHGFRDHVHVPAVHIRIRYTPFETEIQDGAVAERVMSATGAELAVMVRKNATVAASDN